MHTLLDCWACIGGRKREGGEREGRERGREGGKEREGEGEREREREMLKDIVY